MPAKSSTDRYGAVAAGIHWVSALAVILMLASGLAMDNDRALVSAILPVHVVLGLVVGILTLFRIVWWWLFDRHPQPVVGLGVAQQWAARLVHLGLYVAIVIMVFSGVGMLVLTGAAPAIFGGGALPEFSDVPPFGMHAIMSRLLIALVLGHIAAALWHHFVRRDGLIGRMRVGG